MTFKMPICVDGFVFDQDKTKTNDVYNVYDKNEKRVAIVELSGGHLTCKLRPDGGDIFSTWLGGAINNFCYCKQEIKQLKSIAEILHYYIK